MRPKLAAITVTGCHLILVICGRGELADLEQVQVHDACPGPVNHTIPVTTNHRPGGKPGSV
jgi:hypothetical protein